MQEFKGRVEDDEIDVIDRSLCALILSTASVNKPPQGPDSTAQEHRDLHTPSQPIPHKQNMFKVDLHATALQCMWTENSLAIRE